MGILKKITSSWFVVAISFIVWPVGLAFLYMKLYFDGGKLKANKVFLWILAIACCLMVLGGVSVIVENGKIEPADVFVFILFLIGSIASANKAIKAGKDYKYYKTYVKYIGIKNKISIEELAEKTINSIEKVEEDISKMVSYKMIDGYINEENELILLKNNHSINMVGESVKVKPEISSVECKNCGATNQFIENKENRCEFCGSILEKKMKI